MHALIYLHPAHLRPSCHFRLHLCYQVCYLWVSHRLCPGYHLAVSQIGSDCYPLTVRLQIPTPPGSHLIQLRFICPLVVALLLFLYQNQFDPSKILKILITNNIIRHLYYNPIWFKYHKLFFLIQKNLS